MYINRVDESGRPAQPESVKRQRRKQDNSRFDDLLETAIVDSVELTDPDGKKRDAGTHTHRKDKKSGDDQQSVQGEAVSLEDGKGLNVTV